MFKKHSARDILTQLGRMVKGSADSATTKTQGDNDKTIALNIFKKVSEKLNLKDTDCLTHTTCKENFKVGKLN